MASTLQLNLGGRCRAGAICDCSEPRRDIDPVRAVATGRDRLEFRGDLFTVDGFDRVIAAGREARWGEIVVRTHGEAVATVEAARSMRERGVTGVIVPLFAHVSAVHDRIAATNGGLVTALRALRACAAAGLTVSIESPILAPRIQSLEEIVRLAHRAVPGLATVRFFVRSAVDHSQLEPPSWSVAGPALRAALGYCATHRIAAAISPRDGIPLCIAGHDPGLQRAYRFDPRRAVERSQPLPNVCDPCAMKRFCPGPHATSGAEGLVPFTRRQRAMIEQRTTPSREWTDSERRAASQMKNRVLRPTVNCNQDCPFCSANETTDNVIGDASEMHRRIARLARIGRAEGSAAHPVTWLSFSGGEPTLSRHLVSYVRTARRLGIENVELVTNGVLLDSPTKVQPFVDAGITHAFVSLHAHDELLAQRTTSKVGDWERTVRAVRALVDRGVTVRLNHVISAVNYAYLPRFANFVAEQFGDRVSVSLAFVTPQYKAFDDRRLVPRISAVMPYLRRAMRTFVERGIEFVVGSRQGIPPCFLGEYVGWSDFVPSSPSAHAEDAPQKIRAPGCDACRYSPQCVGIWRSYAESYGLDEIVPTPGMPLSADAVRTLSDGDSPAGFDDVHAELRMPMRDDAELPEPSPVRAERGRTLPVVGASQRALRVALLGSGPQAMRIARAMQNVAGITLEGVASPHLLDRDAGPFEGVVRESDAARLLERVGPDAVVIASNTASHFDLVQLALARGVAVLVEKPLARTLDEANAIVSLAAKRIVMPGHNMAFTPGVDAFRARLAEGAIARPTRALFRKRAEATSSDAPRSWNREALYQIVYHAVYVLGVATSQCAATVVRVDANGASRPETLRAELLFADGCRGEIAFDFTAATMTDELEAFDAAGHRLAWERNRDGEALSSETRNGERTASVPRGNDVERMLAAFRDALLEGRTLPVSVVDARDTMATTEAVVAALAEQIARPNAPKHVASPALR